MEKKVTVELNEEDVNSAIRELERGYGSIELIFNLSYVKEFMHKYDITRGQYLGNEYIIGDLFIRDGTIPPLFKPRVDGTLTFSRISKIPVDFAFEVNVTGDLSMNKVTMFPEYFKPSVGGWLFAFELKSILHPRKNIEYESPLSPENNKRPQDNRLKGIKMDRTIIVPKSSRNLSEERLKSLLD